MIVAGFGFRTLATAESLGDALRAASGGRTIDAIATAADKAALPAFVTLAAAVRRPVHGLAPEVLADQATVTCSPASEAARGVGSLAEAAALAAAGPGARLLGPRKVSADRLATCALAEGRRP